MVLGPAFAMDKMPGPVCLQEYRKRTEMCGELLEFPMITRISQLKRRFLLQLEVFIRELGSVDGLSSRAVVVGEIAL